MSESMINGSSTNELTNSETIKTAQLNNPNYPPQFRPLTPQQPPVGGLRPPHDVGPRAPIQAAPPPRLQRVDSRSQFPPQQQIRPQQIPPQQLRPRIPQNGAPQFPQRPINPNQQQQPIFRPPLNQQLPNQQAPRPTGHVPIRPPQLQQQPSNVPPNVGNFKRLVTAVQSGQLATTPEDSELPVNPQPPIFQQRPPQPGPRPPGIFPQRNLPSGPISLPPDVQGSPNQGAIPFNKQQSFTRKPSQESLTPSKLENLTEKPPTPDIGGVSNNATNLSGIDDTVRTGSAKNRSYSISFPGVPPDLTKPVGDDERRKSVSAFGSNVAGVDGKPPSQLAFIQEKLASIEGKSSSQSSLNDSKESLHQNGKISDTRKGPKSDVDKDDDDDVVMPTKNLTTPPKSSNTSPLPPQRTILSNSNTPSNKSPSPNISTRSSVNGSQEDIHRVSPKIQGKTDSHHTESPKSMSRPPSGLAKDNISNSSSREDVHKTPSKMPRSSEGAARPASRENVSRPPSNIEKEHPSVTNVSLDADKVNGIKVSQNLSKPLVIETKASPQKTTTEKKPPSTVEAKTPDSLASTNGKDITSPETDTSRGDLSSSPAPPKPSKSGRKSTSSSRSRSRAEGDNDSGVDESTQGNDSGNGDSSPKKTSKIPKHSATSPTKSTPSKIRPPRTPKTPDPVASTPEVPLIKKVPMNKIQVGAAPSPNLKTVRSKIGSLDNASYRPGGGKVKIETKKLDFGKVQPRIAAKNDAYTPGGGDKKITQVKLKWEAKPKIGSLDNATHKPGGGDKKIETVKLDFKDKAKSKVASKDNIKHQPSGGDIKSPMEGSKQEIEQKKLEFKAQSKIGSLDNVKYKPGGGDKKIFDDKEYLKQMAAQGDRPQSGNQSPVPSEGASSQRSSQPPVSDENLNRES